MTMVVQSFGVLVLPTVAWAQWIESVEHAEAAGFSHVFVDDHVVNPLRPDRPWLDAWVALGAAAHATSTVRLGTMVANVVLRSPVVLARQASTLDHVSGGRLELGLGSGYAATDHRFGGTPVWSDHERSERFAESVGLVASLLAGDPPAAGVHYDTSDVELGLQGVQRPRPPVTVAADGPKALAVAAEHADRWVSFGGWGLTTDENLEVTRRRSELLDERCEAIGRAPADVGRTLLAGSAGVNKDPMWSSVEAFRDFAGRFAEIGIDTIVLYWPPSAANGPVDQRVVDEVIAEVIAPAAG